MNVPRVGVGVVVVQEGHILMGKRKNTHGEGLWAFPGGHLEMGESVEACAIRELVEETGLKAVYCKLGGWSNTVFNAEKHYITLFVYVTAFQGELQLLEPHKCEGWSWFHWQSLPSPLFPPIDPLISGGELERMLKHFCSSALPENRK